jgi:signal transduction histidine kinase
MRSDDAPAPSRPRAPHDPEAAIGTMAHDARNGLSTIVLRAQMLVRRLRGDPFDRDALIRDATEIERVAKRTARRVEDIEWPFARGRAGGAEDA